MVRLPRRRCGLASACGTRRKGTAGGPCHIALRPMRRAGRRRVRALGFGRGGQRAVVEPQSAASLAKRCRHHPPGQRHPPRGPGSWPPLYRMRARLLRALSRRPPVKSSPTHVSGVHAPAGDVRRQAAPSRCSVLGHVAGVPGRSLRGWLAEKAGQVVLELLVALEPVARSSDTPPRLDEIEAVVDQQRV